ncbi:MAG: helix-turn-helix domain-containing protein [Candidatus Thorarchaeota archaeon]
MSSQQSLSIHYESVAKRGTLQCCPSCDAKFGSKSAPSGTRAPTTPRTKPSWIGGPEKSQPPRPRKVSAPKPRSKPRSGGVLLDDMELIEDYAKTIRSARQKKNLSQEELAQKIGERISTLQSIESGRLKPTGKTIRGLERELEVSLLEAVGSVPIKTSRGGPGASPTLGDRVIVKKKMSQKARQDDAD